MAVDTTFTNPTTLARGAGQTLPYANYEDLLSNVYNLGGTGGHVGARAYNSAAISIPDAVNTALTFNSERYDTDPGGEIHSTSSNTGRLTCRTAGKYYLWGSVQFAAHATGMRNVQIVLNGATVLAIAKENTNSGSQATNLQVDTVYDLAAGDYVELIVHQSSGGALNAEAAGNHSPELLIAKV